VEEVWTCKRSRPRRECNWLGGFGGPSSITVSHLPPCWSTLERALSPDLPKTQPPPFLQPRDRLGPLTSWAASYTDVCCRPAQSLCTRTS
jgi:hypothetical protein